MKAITVSFRGATPTKPARYQATDHDGHIENVSASLADSAEGTTPERFAALALCRRMNWTGELHEGRQGRDTVFVWTNDTPFTIEGTPAKRTPADFAPTERKFFTMRVINKQFIVDDTIVMADTAEQAEDRAGPEFIEHRSHDEYEDGTIVEDVEELTPEAMCDLSNEAIEWIYQQERAADRELTEDRKRQLMDDIKRKRNNR